MRRGRKYRQLSGVGRRIARYRARRRRGPRFHVPEPRRWRRELDFRGLCPLETGPAAAARLLTWAQTRPGRADGRATRTWVARALGAQHRHYPGEQTIAVGHQQIVEEIAGKLRGPRLSRQTVQRVVQEMVDDGALFLVARGCSAMVTGDRNHVSVYVVVELVDQLDEPARRAVAELRERLDGHLPVGGVPSVKGSQGGDPLPRTTGTFSPERAGPQRREQPHRYAPRIELERTAATGWLLADLGWCLSEQQRHRLGGLLRPWFDAGWSARAIRAALDRRPDGTPQPGPLPGHRQRDRRDPILIRDLVAVLGGRLKTWRVGEVAGPPPVEAEQPARGRPPLPAQRPAVAAVAAPPAVLRAGIRAAIMAGQRRREADDERFRAARRARR